MLGPNTPLAARDLAAFQPATAAITCPPPVPHTGGGHLRRDEQVAHCCDNVALYASSPVCGSMNRTSTSSASGSNVINNACACDDPNEN